MSNFFEQELRKLFADGTYHPRSGFVGRACLGSLDRNRQVRLNLLHWAMRTTMRRSV